MKRKCSKLETNFLIRGDFNVANKGKHMAIKIYIQ